VVAVLHFGLRLNAILSFWLAYILARPLGASIGAVAGLRPALRAASLSPPKRCGPVDSIRASVPIAPSQA
jgi:hypothetical protein